MSGVCLALAWHPRGEQGRFKRFYPALQTFYQHVVVAVPPEADPAALDAIRDLPGLRLLGGGDWRSGRHLVLQTALAEGADYVHYVDGDRLVRWIETRSDELRRTAERIRATDYLVIGRTAAAFATHPQAQQQTEKLSNDVFSNLLGRPLDLSAGSKGFSSAAAEFVLRNSPPERPMGTDSEWVILLHRGGFAIDSLWVDGLDWETADRYLDHAADAETQRRVADEYDADPANWSMRVQVAREIIDAGFAALRRALKEERGMTQTKSGLDRIAAMFAQAKIEQRAAFLPYFPIGYPTHADSLDAIAAMAAEGVDGFEIGIPFSDPLADGPVIQAATQIALENGTTVRKCIGAVRELRARGVTQPMLLMGYINPLLAYGLENFVRDARAAGADGLIVPDLPPEEGAQIDALCSREGLAHVYMLAPTSNAGRIALVGQRATGFVYVVSLTGITGARAELPSYLTDFIARLRAQIKDTPLVMGFGIGKPEQARRMNDLLDGFIVGSALVRAGKDGVEAVRELAGSLRRALD